VSVIVGSPLVGLLLALRGVAAALLMTPSRACTIFSSLFFEPLDVADAAPDVINLLAGLIAPAA
jgi:hypothetical protein